MSRLGRWWSAPRKTRTNGSMLISAVIGGLITGFGNYVRDERTRQLERRIEALEFGLEWSLVRQRKGVDQPT